MRLSFSFQGVVSLLCLAAVTSFGQESGPELDYLFFKERVQPVLLAKRAGSARCIVCHVERSPFLQPLAPGATTWNNEQSRKNFDAWKAFVVPGNPGASRALLHPLADDAGGDGFHAGGKPWASQADPDWQTLAAWVRGQRLGGLAVASAAGQVRVLQSNAAGDNIHVIDPQTDEIVGLITGVEAPHGVAVASDQGRIYVSNESLETVDVVDAKTLEVFKRIALSGRPNNLSVTRDGAKVYVAISDEPGAVDVIDANSLTKVKTIATKGPIHNVFLTPDNSHVFAGSSEAKTITVIDVARDEVSWTQAFDAGVLAMAFFKAGDGSTDLVAVQLEDLYGFVTLDFATRRILARVEFPDIPGAEPGALHGTLAQGLAVSPDQSVLWAASKRHGAVYAYRPPSCRGGQPRPGRSCNWEPVKRIEVGKQPDWLALTPDGKKLYVAVAGDDVTAVIDTETMAVIERIPVGNVPMRNVAAALTTR